MAAPSLAALFDFETQFDTALVEMLSPLVMQYEAGVYPYFSSVGEKIPRVEVRFIMGKSIGPGSLPQARQAIAPIQPACYNAIIQFECFGRREANLLVTPWNGIIRAALDPRTSTLNANLTYLQVIGLDQVSSQRQVVDDKSDSILIHYTIDFEILPTAWP